MKFVVLYLFSAVVTSTHQRGLFSSQNAPKPLAAWLCPNPLGELTVLPQIP